MPILLGVGAAPVPVLEIDAVVLDRLALQLLDDARVDPRSQRLREPDRGGEGVRVRRVLGQRVERQRAELAGDVGAEEVRAAVDRVDGLALRRLPGVATRERGAGGVQAGTQVRVEERARGIAQAVSLQNCSRRFAETSRR